MTEEEYLTIQNKTKLESAITIMRDILAGEEYGISHFEFRKILKPMIDAQERMHRLIALSED